MTSLRTLLLVLVAMIGAVMIGTAAPAAAHVRLLASNPEAGQAMATPPQSIQLTFDESLRNPPAITVTDPNGTQWAMGKPTLDLKTVTVPTDAKQGPAGKYTINYRVTGQDNHLIVGDVQFDITAAFGQPGAAPEGNAAPQQQPQTAVNHEGHAQGSTPDGSGIPTWVAILGTIVVLGSGAALIIGIRRRR
ncbi:methionine-rich copper-binding protein CopC [Kibdelosporangium banguiense]|uniref:Methionine-rich copper-binding protein CopC n=1 Tax=Kibdelosporangium banguiense TaxID=1365924 RepID=A0ABS4T617_9PSEU|nr:copper resistance CopC family protein [Kibdelosporangium banguiense]MBP2319908.1 methionine-rich copper-binding protein CopC [Kibdelosporangium banguiense]